MGYSEQQEDYMRIIETLLEDEENKRKQAEKEIRKLKAELKTYKQKYWDAKKGRDDYKRIVDSFNTEEINLAPSHSEADFQRLRTQTQSLQKKYRQAQAIIEELRAENKKLEAQVKYWVKK